MSNNQTKVLRITAVLWVIWGVVHAFFGAAIMATGASEGFAAIAAGVSPDAVRADYHPAVSAILNQHGWNLLWFGIVTTVGGVMIWRGSMTAIWVSAMVGGLADLGYLVFIDFGGYGTFVPGTLMTIIAGSAIVLGGWVWSAQRKQSA
jgi:hypothetical protein